LATQSARCMFSKLTGVLSNNFILAAIVCCFFFLNFYTKTLFFRPCSTHQWRQADCLSIAKNYYEEGMHFFQPKIHYQGPKEGKAVSECPILNYSAAALWKVFGEHEFLYRLLEYAIYLLMIFILFNTIGLFFGSWLFAFFSCGLLLTSPLLTYYSLNFIADVPAFSFAVMCLCIFYRFYVNKRKSNFYLALIAGTVAVLLKASALIPLSMIFFFLLADVSGLYKYLKTEKLFDKKVLPLLGSAVSGAIIIAWYRWAIAYNFDVTNNIFLLTVLPIWQMEETETIHHLKTLFTELFPIFLSKPMLFLFFTLTIFVIAHFRKLDMFFRYTFVVAAAYFIFYLLFFFKVFGVHDYYLTNLMILPVVTCFCVADILRKTQFVDFNRGFIKLFLFFFLLFNGFNAAAIYRLKMIEDDKMNQWFPFTSEEDQKLYKYLFWDYGNSIKKIENFRPVLREHGIKREDLVVSVPDQSFDISLYFLDQKGYCVSREHFMLDSMVTEHFRGKGIKYFVLSDTTLKRQISFRRLKPYLRSFFVENKVEVFKVDSNF
jgi:hypothetical protein